jgi:hypothetical protein
MAKPQRPNVNSGLDTSQNKAVSVAGKILTSANIVGQCHEVNSDPDRING